MGLAGHRASDLFESEVASRQATRSRRAVFPSVVETSSLHEAVVRIVRDVEYLIFSCLYVACALSVSYRLFHEARHGARNSPQTEHDRNMQPKRFSMHSLGDSLYSCTRPRFTMTPVAAFSAALRASLPSRD